MVIELTDNINKTREPQLHRRIKELLNACGIDPEDVSPKLLGKGLNHKVYRFKKEKKVVKIPGRGRFGMVSSFDEEVRNIQLYQEYFSEFAVPTTLVQSDHGYCVVMDYIDGKVLTEKDVFEENKGRRKKRNRTLNSLGMQLQKIVAANNALTQATGYMIDLVGLDGGFDVMGGRHLRRKPARLANIL